MHTNNYSLSYIHLSRLLQIHFHQYIVCAAIYTHTSTHHLHSPIYFHSSVHIPAHTYTHLHTPGSHQHNTPIQIPIHTHTIIHTPTHTHTHLHTPIFLLPALYQEQQRHKINEVGSRMQDCVYNYLNKCNVLYLIW